MIGNPGPWMDRRAAHEARRARRAAVTDPAVVMEAAAQFLAVRSRSVSETRRRLLQLGYDDAVTEAVLANLERLGYLDDQAFAQAWLESRDRSRPRGEAVLRQELQRKGVDGTVISVALSTRAAGRVGSVIGPAIPTSAGADDDPDAQRGSVDRDLAQRLLQRRGSSLARERDPRKRRQKAYSLLARNGFDPGICRDVSILVLDGPSGEDAVADAEDDTP